VCVCVCPASSTPLGPPTAPGLGSLYRLTHLSPACPKVCAVRSVLPNSYVHVDDDESDVITDKLNLESVNK
jgi:hypothetical protein